MSNDIRLIMESWRRFVDQDESNFTLQELNERLDNMADGEILEEGFLASMFMAAMGLNIGSGLDAGAKYSGMEIPTEDGNKIELVSGDAPPEVQSDGSIEMGIDTYEELAREVYNNSDDLQDKVGKGLKDTAKGMSDMKGGTDSDGDGNIDTSRFNMQVNSFGNSADFANQLIYDLATSNLADLDSGGDSADQSRSGSSANAGAIAKMIATGNISPAKAKAMAEKALDSGDTSSLSQAQMKVLNQAAGR